MRDYLDELKKKNEETAMEQAGAKAKAEVIEIRDEDRSRFYWFRKNLAKRIKAFAGRNKVLFFILSLILIYVLFVSRAAYQPAILIVRRYLLLFLLFIAVAWLAQRKYVRSSIRGKIGAGALFIGVCALLWFFGKSTYEYVRMYTHFQKLDKIELNDLPVTRYERIQPLNSIRTLVKQELLTDTESATDPRFSRRQNGSYDFSMAVGPSPAYKIQQASKDMYKVISVSATDPAPDFSARNQYDANFNIGEFLLFGKRTPIAVGKRLNFLQYFNYQPSETFFIENDAGKWVQVVSLIKWKGWFIPRPVFGGVMVIDQAGTEGFGDTVERILFGKGKFYSPEAIQEIPYLRGQNLVPEMVTTFTANSFRFQEGFLAPMPGYHEGDVRIPSLQADQNKMPFVAFFDYEEDAITDKLYHYYGLEPYDKDKQALNTSLFLPADGGTEVFYIDHAAKKDAYIGSSSVSSKIIESRKNYDWSKNHPVEFRPYMREVDGQRRFFWLSTVVTKVDDGSGGFIGGSIPEVTLTDARISQVVWLEKQNLPTPEAWDMQLQTELGSYWNPGSKPSQTIDDQKGINDVSTSEVQNFRDTYIKPILNKDYETVIKYSKLPLKGIWEYQNSKVFQEAKSINDSLKIALPLVFNESVRNSLAEMKFEDYDWEHKLLSISINSTEEVEDLDLEPELTLILTFEKKDDGYQLVSIDGAG